MFFTKISAWHFFISLPVPEKTIAEIRKRKLSMHQLIHAADLSVDMHLKKKKKVVVLAILKMSTFRDV